MPEPPDASCPLCSLIPTPSLFRDAIAKVLYALLFSWLITRVNALVSPHQDMLSIAILDIYGFEVALRVCVRGRGHKASSLAFLCLWRNHYQGPLPLLFSLLSSTIFFAYPHCQALSEARPCAGQHEGPWKGPDLGPSLREVPGRTGWRWETEINKHIWSEP